MAFCGTCGAQIADGTTTCAACASKVPAGGAAVAAAPSSGAMADNVAGMLAYVTIIPAIIFLVMEPYNKNRFIRFHAFQCIFLFVAWFAIAIALMIVGFIPVLGLLTIPLHFVVLLGMLALWIIMLIKANAGQMYKLPIIGAMAEKQANAM